MHHCRQCNVFPPTTRATIPAEKVIFPPTKFPMPETSGEDKLTAVVEDLVHELKHQPHPATPLLDHGAPVNRGINKLKEFFQLEPAHQFATPLIASTHAPSPRVTSPPDSSPRWAPRNLFGATRATLQGIDRGNILHNRTRSHNNQPALFTKGHSKAIAFLAHEAAACKQVHLGLAVTHHITGKQMECQDLIKDPHH